MEEGAVSLSELQSLIKGSLENSFYEKIWLRAEISELKVNASSGHCYLTLVEKSPVSGRLKAKAQAIIWASTYRVLRSVFESHTGRQLAPGMSVLVGVQVQYSELYGLSLIIYDIDSSFSLGELEKVRQQTVLRLEKEGLMGLNGSLKLAPLPRKFALITSPGAAGYRDFMRHLHENEYGYRFETELFSSPMQGDEAPRGIIEALESIKNRMGSDSSAFDAVLIMRGGGGAMDLVCFDDYALSASIARFPLPVLTGIGHDHDYHVADMVAHTNVKTPTALADFIIDIFAQAEYSLDSLLSRLHLAVRTKGAAQTSSLDRMKLRIRNAVSLKSSAALSSLDGMQSGICAAVSLKSSAAVSSLDRMRLRICSAAGIRFSSELASLDRMEVKVAAVDPDKVLSRGFSLTLKNGRRVDSASSFSAGDKIVTMFRDGVVVASVLEVKPSAASAESIQNSF